MSDEIKKLVRRLRDHGKYLQDALGLNNAPFALTSAADALEALVKERDQMLIDLNEYRLEVEMLEGKVEQLMDEAQEAKE